MKDNPNYKANLKQQTKLTAEQLQQINDIEQIAIAKFSGDLTELESALGMLKLGYQYGWRTLYLIHSKATVKKYEQILGISVSETFPAEGPSYKRLVAYKVLQAITNFWKVVSGEEKVAEKRIVK